MLVKELNRKLVSELTEAESYIYDAFTDEGCSEYTSDLILSCANQMIDVYYHDVWNWLRSESKPETYMDAAASMGLIDVSDYSFSEHIRGAQYLWAQDQVKEALSDSSDKLVRAIVYCCLTNIKSNAQQHTSELDAECEYIIDHINDLDSYRRTDDFRSDVFDLVVEYETPEEAI